MTPDLAGHIGDIARRLLGEPNKTLSTKTELRFGSKGSVSVEIAGPNRGQWYDHENQIGGGAWKLLTVKSGKSNGEAIDWLAFELGIKVDPETDRHNGKIVATYDYRDESGRLLFQVVRLEPKDFRQRCPDGAGGWIWKTRGVRKVLYRLPELLAAPADEKVFIVEGEKDVNRLVELRFIATCNPGGVAKNRAGERPGRSKWLPGFNPPFRSRHVVIIPDNDEAGAAHAELIAHELVSIASSVRRISLPGLLPKGVSDWLDAGGTREELERLAAAAQPYKTPTAKTAAQDDVLHDYAKIAELAKLAPLAWAYCTVLRDWMLIRKGTLNGFASVILLSGLQIDDVQVLLSNGSPWATLPAKPVITSKGLDANVPRTNKIQCFSFLRWHDRAPCQELSPSIVKLVRARDPEVLG
jgi:hypothetical protein